jgi:hypothetical protein
MSRRSGQTGNIVVAGKWYRVRWREDVEGQEQRFQRRPDSVSVSV